MINLFRNNDFIFYKYYKWYYTRKIKKAKTIWVITTPGHVGSSTTFRSLRDQLENKNNAIFDIHSIFEHFNNQSIIPSRSARHVLQEVLMNSYVKYRNDKSWKIVTLVRDPISRAIGGIFQSKEIFMSGIDIKSLHPQNFDNAKQGVFLKIVKATSPTSKLTYVNDTIQWQLAFYQNEYIKFWGFPEDQLKANQNIHKHILNGTNYFILKLELLEEGLKELGKHIGIPLKMIKSNSAEQRMGKDVAFYKYCVQNFTFPLQFIEEVYGHPFWRKVYSENEINNFKNHWASKDADL